MKKPMTCVEAACLVLREEPRGLHAKEIVRRILQKQLVKTGGKTPDATIRGRIAEDVKRPEGRIEKVGRGTYALRKR